MTELHDGMVGITADVLLVWELTMRRLQSAGE